MSWQLATTLPSSPNSIKPNDDVSATFVPDVVMGADDGTHSPPENARDLPNSLLDKID